MKNGTLFVISSPSGGGKSTVISKILEKNQNLSYSISATTRKPRAGENEGEDYYFMTKKQFREYVKDNRFLEWAEVHNNYYGTLKSQITEMLENGKHVILDIDVQGGKAVKECMPESVLIFLMPPSIEELEKRLRSRGTDSDEDIVRRLLAAEQEMEQKDKYDYTVVNDTIDQSVKKVETIINHFS